MLEKHVSMLGLRVKDAVTGKIGCVTSISFDLYGCIQAVVLVPETEKREQSNVWYDISRLTVVKGERVMPLPDFAGVAEIAKGKKGPAEKPM